VVHQTPKIAPRVTDPLWQCSLFSGWASVTWLFHRWPQQMACMCVFSISATLSSI